MTKHRKQHSSRWNSFFPSNSEFGVLSMLHSNFFFQSLLRVEPNSRGLIKATPQYIYILFKWKVIDSIKSFDKSSLPKKKSENKLIRNAKIFIPCKWNIRMVNEKTAKRMRLVQHFGYCIAIPFLSRLCHHEWKLAFFTCKWQMIWTIRLFFYLSHLLSFKEKWWNW